MMYLFVAARILSECALWLGFGGVILGVFAPVSNLTLSLAVFGGSAVLCQILEERKPALRYVGLGALLLLIPLWKGVGDALLTLPLGAYLVSCVHTRVLRPDRTGVYYRFPAFAAAALLGAFLSVLSARPWCFLCCLLAVFLHLFLSRMLRHQQSDALDRRLAVMEIVLLTLLCLGALLISQKAVLASAVYLVKRLYMAVIYPIVLLLLYGLLAILWVFDRILSIFFTGKPDFSAIQMPQIMGDMAQQLQPEGEPAGNPLLVLIVRIGGAIVFLIAAYFLFRALRAAGTRQAQHSKEAPLNSTPDAPIHRFVNIPPSVLDRSPAASVRRTFAAYCRWVRSREATILPSHTSRDVNALAYLDSDPAAMELRQLYLRSRYPRESDLTREDARRAAALLKEITSGKS